MAQYTNVESNHDTIEYINPSKFIYEDVDSHGYMCELKSIKVDGTMTVDDICGTHSKHTRMVQMKNGEIHRIVPPTCHAVQLIDDGYKYRVDQYKHTLIGAGEDAVNICVKFIGNSPQERKKTPLVLKIGKDLGFYSIGYHVQGMGLGLQPDEVKNILYSIDGECVHSNQSLNGYYETVCKPNDPDFIQIISLEMPKRKPKIPPPSNSYRKLFSRC